MIIWGRHHLALAANQMGVIIVTRAESCMNIDRAPPTKESALPLQSMDTPLEKKVIRFNCKCRKISTKKCHLKKHCEECASSSPSFVLCCPRWFGSMLAACFIPWSHYCLRLRCPCSLWFVGNELAPPCPCSIILIEKVISHSAELIRKGKSMNPNRELTCSQPAERRGVVTLMLGRWRRCGWKRGEMGGGRRDRRVAANEVKRCFTCSGKPLY